MIKHLKTIKTSIAPLLAQKFEEFKKNYEDDRALLNELLFCLLTPQSKAENCWEAVKCIEKKNYKNLQKIWVK